MDFGIIFRNVPQPQTPRCLSIGSERFPSADYLTNPQLTCK